MRIIDSLLCHDEWLQFYDYKISGGHLPKSAEKELKNFIDSKAYLTTAERLVGGGFFGIPKAAKVNKSSSEKKRIVFTFSAEEKYIQKFLAYKLLGFDGIFADNLFSFRRDMGVKKAVLGLVNTAGISEMYSYKLDISDYFNSVSADILLPQLKEVLRDEPVLFSVIENLLNNPYAEVEGETQMMKKGIIAGCPLSGFLANLYLTELDKLFESHGVLYARYSDDIIFFCKSESELQACIDTVNEFLQSRRLTVNESKVFRTAPHEEWTFLGFSYCDGEIDISDISKQKLKKKMRRKARGLLRWKERKGVSAERAAAAFIRYFDKKLYANDANHQITWCRWYFPLITTEKGLREIDEYMQQCLRYIATGKQNKAQYRFKYGDMKRLGYTTLVNRYYKFKQTGELPAIGEYHELKTSCKH